MERDPFYRQIVERLNGHLDDDLFQVCAGDLLGAIFPGLVPYRGGDDAGMDGAVPDGEGEPFPLIVTTGEDAIGNLTRNLNTYLAEIGTRRKAVFATSQALTPRRIRNLHHRAEELGFTLVGAFTQEWFARALYRNSAWCRDLLGLTGIPAALSTIPLTNRPLLDQPLVGRETTLEWLVAANGDRLLVGQPGSGKTFLLYQFAQSNNGLFAVSEDLGEIANAVRAEQPRALIVDDAQIKIHLLESLVHLRREIGAEFIIITSSWPGEQERVAQVLQLGDAAIHTLELLTRDQIVQVIKAAGVYGPNGLVHEIVNQAEGRPGLAVTLAHVCISSGPRELFLGDAISRSVRSYFTTILGQDVVAILAAFAAGGDSGIPKDAVARELNFSLASLWSTVIQLAAGGILWEGERGCLSVYPIALRHALVRDVFFQGGASLDIDPIIRHAPDLEAVAQTLIGAQARGAHIRTDWLLSILQQVNSDRLWLEYAWLGERQAAWVLENYPQRIVAIAQPALERASHLALPQLFTAAVGDTRPLHSTTEHPLRLIQDWVHSAEPGTGEVMICRKALLESLRLWLNGGGDVQIGLRALQIAFSPRFEESSTDPGIGTTVTIRFGCITRDEIAGLETLWPEAFSWLRGDNIQNWQPLFDLLGDWVFPGRMNVRLPEDISAAMRQFGNRMVQDVVALASGSPGILRIAKQLVQDSGIPLEIEIPPEFEVLYPTRQRPDWRAAEAEQRTQALSLASIWSRLAPTEVAARISVVEHEARETGVNYPRWTDYVCCEIAGQVDSPLQWAREILEVSLTGDLLLPFLEKSAAMQESGWDAFAFECLQQPTLVWAVAKMVLCMGNPPAALLSQVMQNLTGLAQMVETICIRNQSPLETVHLLLDHPDPDIASAAAQGEWYCDPKGTARPELLAQWRQVVVTKAKGEYWVSEILKQDPDLAYEWLMNHLPQQTRHTYREDDETIIAALSVLSTPQRQIILEQIPDTFIFADWVRILVGDDLQLYSQVLANRNITKLHLAPLAGYPDSPTWLLKAQLALDAEYSPEQAANAVYGIGMYSVSWSGNESQFWQGWYERFGKLLSHEDERIRKIGEIGQREAERKRDRALEEEHTEAVYGIYETRRHRRGKLA